MFLKLCKHELKNSYRSFLFMYAVLLISAYFISMRQDESFATIVLAFIYGASMIALLIMVFVSVIRNYIKTMFSRTAYLTHTLPVAEWKLLLSKVLISFLWIVASLVFIILSAYGLSYNILGSDFNITITNITVQIMSQSWYIFLLLGILQIFQFILLVFFSITITHTRFVPRFRPIVSLVIYFILNQVISLVMNFGLSFITKSETVFVYDGYTYTYDIASVIGSAVFLLVICTLLYMGCIYILKHHLEIE